MPTEVKDIFEANSRSLKELMSENGLGLYIPAYQRPYGWDSGKVTKLLDDILHGLNVLVTSEDSFTFLGSIITIHDINNVTVHPMVKDQVPGKVLTIIDGQQRISSLVMLAVAMHNQVALKLQAMFGNEAPDPDDYAAVWVWERSLDILKGLASTFFEEQSTGEAPIYPRVIRAFSDQWSRRPKQAQYRSPIANLVAAYTATCVGKIPPVEFRPSARVSGEEASVIKHLTGESALIQRYNEVRKALHNLAIARESDDYENIPALEVFASTATMQKALFNHELSDDAISIIKDPQSQNLAPLVRLLILASYILNRVAMTVVKGKNEDYAFTIFESLNTTGEPLTAFETFKPRVVSAEGLEEYGESSSRRFMDEIDEHLSQFAVGVRLQTATTNLLVNFALAETGFKLPKRLADQRSYLRQEFERHHDNSDSRNAFLRSMRDVGQFVKGAWTADEPTLPGLPDSATTDQSKLCLAFLRKLNHSITIGPIVRFYSRALEGEGADHGQRLEDVEAALKAVTAFSVFWRSSRRTTGNIDREYRQIMAGSAEPEFILSGPLARTSDKNLTVQPCLPDISTLKAEFRERLKLRGGIEKKADWISLAKSMPLYAVNGILTRFLLLAAYHDSVPEGDSGLIKQGKSDFARCLNYESFLDERYLTLEHVAPKSGANGWSDSSIYVDRELVDRIGNLVLAQGGVNSVFSDKPWLQKRALYAALSAPTSDQARSLLAAYSKDVDGVTFAASTEEIVDQSRYMPHLAAVGALQGDWSAEFIEARSERLLGLAWDRLWPWLLD